MYNLYVSTPTVKTGVQVNGFRIEPTLLTQRNKQQPLRRFQIGQLRLIQTAHTVPQRLQQLKIMPRGLTVKRKSVLVLACLWAL
jgi:hypothetical protein